MASVWAPGEAAHGRGCVDSVLCSHDVVLSFSGNFRHPVPHAYNFFIDCDSTVVDRSLQGFTTAAQEGLSSRILLSLIALQGKGREKERQIFHPLIVWRSEHTPESWRACGPSEVDVWFAPLGCQLETAGQNPAKHCRFPTPGSRSSVTSVPSLTWNTWNDLAGEGHRMFLWLPGHLLRDTSPSYPPPRPRLANLSGARVGTGLSTALPLGSKHAGSLVTVLGGDS